MELALMFSTLGCLGVASFFYYLDWRLPKERQFWSWQYKVSEVFFTLALVFAFLTAVVIF